MNAIPARYLNAIDADAWRRRAAPVLHRLGETLFYRGHNPYGFYILYFGSVEMSAPGILETVRPSDGWAAILDRDTIVRGGPHAYTARLNDDGWLSFVDRFAAQASLLMGAGEDRC